MACPYSELRLRLVSSCPFSWVILFFSFTVLQNFLLLILLIEERYCFTQNVVIPLIYRGGIDDIWGKKLVPGEHLRADIAFNCKWQILITTPYENEVCTVWFSWRIWIDKRVSLINSDRLLEGSFPSYFKLVPFTWIIKTLTPMALPSNTHNGFAAPSLVEGRKKLLKMQESRWVSAPAKLSILKFLQVSECLLLQDRAWHSNVSSASPISTPRLTVCSVDTLRRLQYSTLSLSLCTKTYRDWLNWSSAFQSVYLFILVHPLTCLQVSYRSCVFFQFLADNGARTNCCHNHGRNSDAKNSMPRDERNTTIWIYTFKHKSYVPNGSYFHLRSFNLNQESVSQVCLLKLLGKILEHQKQALCFPLHSLLPQTLR